MAARRPTLLPGDDPLVVSSAFVDTKDQWSAPLASAAVTMADLRRTFHAPGSTQPYVDRADYCGRADCVESRAPQAVIPEPTNFPARFLLGQARFIYLDSRFLSRIRRPVRLRIPNCLARLRVQSLPAAELHGVGADHAANWSSAEKVIQNIEQICHRAAPIEMKR